MKVVPLRLLYVSLVLTASAAGAAELVIPSGAAPSSRLAATEFTNYVFKSTGRSITIREGTPGEQTKVVIGTVSNLPFAPPEALKALAATDNPEASWSGKAKGLLWLVGKAEVAELYATYHFLEAKVGVRWFKTPTAEDPGEYVPKQDRLVVADYAEFREPAFHERLLGLSCAVWLGLPTNSVPMAMRAGFQVGSPIVWWDAPDAPADFKAFYSPRVPRWMRSHGGGHDTFEAFLRPRERFFKEHPEWFAQVGGKRVNGRHVCFSNLRLLDHVSDEIIRKFETAGGEGSFLFGMSDFANGFCECPSCQAWDPKGVNDGKAVVDVSVRFRRAVRYIADRIYAVFPKADLRLWAYSNYREPPAVDGLDPRMKVEFCAHGRCYGHALNDSRCLRNRKVLDLIRSWRKFGSDMTVYEYFTCTPPLYCCRETTEPADIRFAQELGIKGWKSECVYSDSRLVDPWRSRKSSREMNASNWQWLYVTGHLLWDPTLDAERLLADAETHYYGAAYPAMKRYQALRRLLWIQNPFCMGYPTGDQRRPALMSVAGTKDELLAALAEAEKLSADDAVVRHRVAQDRRWLEEYWIKENEEAKAKAGKTIGARRLPRAVKLGEKDLDPVWSGVSSVTDFASALDDRHQTIPTELATSASVLSDEDNLYFLFSAKEPSVGKMKLTQGHDSDVWSGDSIELFLYPPSVDNRICHLAVNAKGTIYDSSDPGGVVSDDFGAEAHGRIHADRYVIELKVPSKKIAPLRNGETWKVLFARNRTVHDNLTPQGGCWSLGGCEYRDHARYRSMVIGASNIENGSFDRLDAKGKPVGWAVSPPGAEVVRDGENVSVRIRSGYVFQMLSAGAFAQKLQPRIMKYSLRASGKGRIKVCFFRYQDPDPEAQTGAGRKFLPTVESASFQVDETCRLFSGTYEIPANEWVAIAFTVGAPGDRVTIDDVSAVRADK